MKSIYKHIKKIAVLLLLTMIVEIFSPLTALALTGGPSQPEVQGFQPVGASDMVDLFTGDFSYNIPLLDVEGYPINLSYSSSISSDQESSWVGLGWNINPGVINRSMRGIPDEFSGDVVRKEYNMKRNLTFGGSFAPSLEVLGKELKLEKLMKNFDKKFPNLSLQFSLGLRYNNYTGFAAETTITPGFSTNGAKGSLNGSLGLTSGPDGLTINPDIGFDRKVKNSDENDNKIDSRGGTIGSSYNSRSGFKSLTIDVSSKVSSKARNGQLKGNNATASIGLNSYTPVINMPMMNSSVSFKYKMGGKAMGVFANGSISGYISEQHVNLAYNEMIIPSFGYNNSNKALSAAGTVLGMQDVNRDWDGGFTLNTPNLPLTNFTYDFFNVSGQGVSGTFRPFRNDLGYVSDNYAQNISMGGSMGLEAGFGNTNQTGFNYELNDVTTTTQTWLKNNSVAERYAYKDKVTDNPLYEPYTYKQLGELSVDDEPEFFDNIGKENAVRLDVDKNGLFQSRVNSLLINQDEGVQTFDGTGYRTKRLKRNQTLNIITQAERKARGDKGLQDLGYIPSHHTSEINITRNDGARYIYGIPAYNRRQEETTFAIGIKDGIKGTKDKEKNDFQALVDQTKGVYSYSKNADNSINNENGIDNLFSNTIMPGYAHSYLLTCVLSPDYVDADKIPGPSDHDIGNYTRFEYDKLPSIYKWRSPFGQNEANYNEGLKSDFRDDKANYVYGEKELWYLKKIETKNTIAIFHTESRKDGFGVHDKNGGIGNISTLKLVKISLYSKKDYLTNPSTAIPIKEVHFEYNYSLCPGIENNNGVAEMVNGININEAKGKLTLTRVYFTYGKSNKAKFSPYTFNYAPFNPSYGIKNYDRWGNYQPNPVDGDIFNPSVSMTNSEFPYTRQDKALIDQYTSAWTLQKIQLPSGGKIEVFVESDDYAYVQDRRAMEMFNVVSLGKGPAFLNLDNKSLMEKNGLAYQNNLYLKIKLKNPLPITTTKGQFKEKFIGEMKDIHFKCLVDITGKNHYEFVSGYAEIEDYDLLNTNPTEYNYAWIKLKEINQNSNGNSQNVHPISKAAWNFGLTQMSDAVLDKNVPEKGGFGDFLRIFSNAIFVKSLIQTLKGPLDVMQSNKCGFEMSLSKSVVRLYSPEGKKLGGGLRVKKITVSDIWSEIADPLTATTQVTGSEYTYTTTKDGNTISSGVAAWEPAIGNEENPFVEPIYFGTEKKERLVEIKSRNYLEDPIGESFYPSPSVGYSKVTVSSLTNPNINRHGTGKVVNEFYTAKEFPVITKSTTIDPIEQKTPLPLKLLQMYSKDFLTVSQGYSIIVNDMHGKQKSVKVYQNGQDEPISGQIYEYQSEAINKESKKLVNTCTVVNADGTTAERELGVEFDFAMDFREQETQSISPGMSPNLSSFLAAFIPAIVPSVWPSFTKEDTRFRSAVATKVIYKYGILRTTTVFDLGSKISTNNLAYDAETGLVLLTQTKNEFHDNIYNFNYPAHWYYNRMGQAYKNLGLNFDNVTITSGVLSGIADAGKYFVKGDELLLNGGILAWVVAVNGNTVTVINKAGDNMSGSFSKLKIIRSGRKNVIGTGMGTIVSMVNPLPLLRANQFNEILNSTVQVFKDEWDTFCECFENSNSPMLNTSNPFLTGKFGTWRPFKSYAYLTPRKQTWEDNNTNIRKDGVYKEFNPFWKWQGAAWGTDESNWTWTSEITNYTPYGAEIENRDALYRYSAALFGYNKSIPTAVAGNMQYRELAFDGFEDYDYPSCSDDHFSFRGQGPILVNDAHTGKKSIEVTHGLDKKVSKVLNNCSEIGN